MPDGQGDVLKRCRDYSNRFNAVLATIASGTLEEGYEHQDFVLLCLDLEDEMWSLAADQLLEKFECEKTDDGRTIIGRMSVDDMMLVFGRTSPELVTIVAKRESNHRIRVIVGHAEGIALFMDEFTGASGSN